MRSIKLTSLAIIYYRVSSSLKVACLNRSRIVSGQSAGCVRAAAVSDVIIAYLKLENRGKQLRVFG